MDLHVVIGATGGTGTALVRELRRRGHRVRAVNRTGDGRFGDDVEVAAGDATDAAGMRELCQGATAVYNCVNPPFDRWTTTFPDAVRGTVEGAAAAGARLVFADDTWMYGRVRAPMTESTPVRPVGGKGVLRAWLAELVLAADARGTCRTVIGRAGELYGPLVDSVLGDGLFGAAVRGRPLRWIGELDHPFTPTYIGDFASVLATLGEGPDALLGQVWHVPHPDPVTGRELVDMIRARTGTRAPLVRLGSGIARRLGAVWPLAREGAELVYQFEMPFVVDGSAFATRFPEFAPTSWAEGVDRTLNWYRSSAPTERVPTPERAAA